MIENALLLSNARISILAADAAAGIEYARAVSTCFRKLSVLEHCDNVNSQFVHVFVEMGRMRLPSRRIRKYFMTKMLCLYLAFH
jgi:hypothetical protein